MDFETALAQFQAGEIGFDGLQAALQSELALRPGAAPQIAALLEQLYRGGRLPIQLYSMLKQQLPAGIVPPASPPPPRQPPQAPQPPQGQDSTQPGYVRGSTAPPPGSQPPPPPPPPPPDDGEKTRFRMPPAATEPPADQDEPDDRDKTRLKMPSTGGAEPTGSDAQPTGAQHTGAPTGPTPTDTGMYQTGAAPTGGQQQTSGPTASGMSSWSGLAGDASGGVQFTVGSIVSDRYVLESVIGEGGMGIVYLALDRLYEEAQDRNPYVALKLLNEEFKKHPDALKALQREVRKTQNLAHPNIVTVWQFARDGSNIYMTMEHLEGEPLDDLIRRNKLTGIPIDEALEILRGLCSGLAYAHERGVVHSDFKPANAFLTKQGIVKIFDFGIARASKSGIDADAGDKTMFDAGELGALTPTYASLEMLEGEEPDFPDDVYALACVAYELFTGRHPYARKTAREARDTNMVPAPVKGLSRKQNKGLVKGLAYGRDNRTPSVKEFEADLQPLKIQKSVAIGGAVLVVLIVVFLVTWIPGFLEQRRIDNLRDLIAAGATVEITANLEDIRSLERGTFLDLFDADTQERFIEYYRGRISEFFNIADERYDYPAADELMNELQDFFPDSKTVADIRVNLDSDRADKIASLYEALSALLESGTMLPEQGRPNVTEVVLALTELQPDEAIAGIDAVSIGFARDALAATNAGELLLADRLVDGGLAIAPDESALLALRDRVDNEMVRQEQALRIAQLQDELSNVLAAQPGLEQLGRSRALISDLQELDSGNPVLQQAQERVSGEISTQLAQLAGDGQFDSAADLLNEFAPLLGDDFVNTQTIKLNSQQAKFNEAIDGLLARLDTSIQQIKSGNAPASEPAALVAQLEAAGARTDIVADARSNLANAYAQQSRLQQEAANWEGARASLRRSAALVAGTALEDEFLRELGNVDARQAATEAASVAEQAELERQLLAREVNDLQQAYERAAAASEFSIEDARVMLGALEQLDVRNAPISGGQAQVERLIRARADQLRTATDVRAAIDYARQGTALLPDSQPLAQTLAALEAEDRAMRQQEIDRSVQAALAQIDAELSKGVLDAAAQSRLAGSVRALEEAAGKQDVRGVAARERIAAAYVEEVVRLRNANSLDSAGTLLATAGALAPQLAAIQVEEQNLSAAREQLRAEKGEQERLAQRDLKKKQLVSEAGRGNFERSLQLLAELKRDLGADDPFIKTQAPEAIADAYIVAATNAANGKRFDSALAMVDRGLEIAPGYAPLTAARARIQESSTRPVEKTAVAGAKTAAQPAADQSGQVARASANALLNAFASSKALDMNALQPQLRRLREGQNQLYKEYEGQFVGSLQASISALANTDRSSAQTRANNAKQMFPSVQFALPRVAPKDRCAQSRIVGKGKDARAICWDELADGSRGPRMVVVPAGGPLTSPLAFSKYEISNDDFKAYCVASGACKLDGVKGDLPTVTVSAATAQGYAAWLSTATGQQYRLPSTEEWLYAANANGQQPGKNFNCEVRQGGKLIKGVSLAPVATGQPNGWGLVNYVGNAREWVSNGSGWAARGGSYKDKMSRCELELSEAHSGQPDNVTGFRLVRVIAGGG